MADIRCPATCGEVIAYLQQFDPNDTVWVLGKPPKQPPKQSQKESPTWQS
jgi:hypothetical protein